MPAGAARGALCGADAEPLRNPRAWRICNRIDAARQALREQVAAREQAEHLLQEARTTIQTLETKLAHERIGKDEALRRLEDELAAERAARQQAEQDRDKAMAAGQDAEERGRPPKASQPEGRFVEWWKPNWRERLR